MPGSQEGGGEEGKESLVATVCTCADFSTILQNLDTYLYVHNTKRHRSKYTCCSKCLLMPVILSILLSCLFALEMLDLTGVCLKWMGNFRQKGFIMCLPTGCGKRDYVIRLFLSSRTSSLVVQPNVLTILYDSLHYKNVL